MNFADFKRFTVPEGEVVSIRCGDTVLWKASGELPSAYRQVEWIRAASGVNAYIDTGLKFVKGATVYMSAHFDDMSQGYLFGTAESSGKYRFMITAPYGSSKAAHYTTVNGTNYNYVLDIQTGENLLYFRAKRGNVVYENKTTGKKSTGSVLDDYSIEGSLYLLAQNYNGNLRCLGTRKVGFFEFYDNDDVLTSRLLPCYRKSDGVIGMYDTVRGLFLTNAGSGSFTKGADV